MNLFITAVRIAAVNVRLGLDEQLEVGNNRQLRDLVDANSRPELRRRSCAQRSGLKLQVPNWRQSGRRGYGHQPAACLGRYG